MAEKSGNRATEQFDIKPRVGGGSGKAERVPKVSSRLSKRISALGRGSGSNSATNRGGHPARGKAAAHVKPPSVTARRSVVKARVVKMTAAGKKAAALHTKYIEREGVEKDGSEGKLYGESDEFDRDEFTAELDGENHQFRFIVSPEDAADMDLTEHTKKLMKQVEADLGKEIRWGAVNHYNTENPHTHIVVRGIDKSGQELRMDREYISNGIRNRSRELVTKELGPRTSMEVEQSLSRDVDKERLTPLDRQIEQSERSGKVDLGNYPDQRGERIHQNRLVARLQKLEQYGLAKAGDGRTWEMREGWKNTLTKMGERNDIIKNLHQHVNGDMSKYRVYDGAAQEPQQIQGRVARKGLSDELNDKHYVAVETPDGKAYHVDVRSQSDIATVREGDIVTVKAKQESWGRTIDKSINDAASANGGVYDPIQQRREYGSSKFVVAGKEMQSTDYVEAQERRLASLAKQGLVKALPDSRYSVPGDLQEKLAKKDIAKPLRSISVAREGTLRFGQQVNYRGRTWVDRYTPDSEQLGVTTGKFPKELKQAVTARREFVKSLGVDPNSPNRAQALDAVEKRDLAARLSGSGEVYKQFENGAKFKGTVSDAGEQGSGKRYAKVMDAQTKQFDLVPWRKEFSAMAGKDIAANFNQQGKLMAKQIMLQRGR